MDCLEKSSRRFALARAALLVALAVDASRAGAQEPDAGAPIVAESSVDGGVVATPTEAVPLSPSALDAGPLMAVAMSVIEGRVTSPELHDGPVAGATVSAGGRSTTVDGEGHFQLELSPGAHELRIAQAGFVTLTERVRLAPGETRALALSMTFENDVIQVVVAAGSRSPRSNVETPVPVDIITADDIARSGQTETAKVLAKLVPSFWTSAQTVADGSDHVAPASLRGLGPDQVLVLVNGKRRHTSALLHVNGTFGRGTVGTDLNAIPPASIKRIEVLRDGAATQYGSDAIAGVINIVLKDQHDRTDLSAMSGVTGEGDGTQVRTSANTGVRLGKRGGFLNLTGEFLWRQATNRSGRYTGTVFSDDRAADDAALRERGLTRDDFQMRIGESAAVAGMASFNLEVPLSEHTTLYSFGGLTHRDGRAAGFYRFPKQVPQVVPELYPNGFLPKINSTIDDLSLSAGLKTRTERWKIDLSVTHGTNLFRFTIDDTNNASLGAESPTTFQAGGLSFGQTVGDLDLSRPIEVSWLQSLAFVVGTEYRLDRYQIHAGEERSYSQGPVTFGTPPQPKAPGAQVFPGFQPSNEVDRTRHNVGAYAGFESDPIEHVTLDFGGRIEHYSDFGNAVIGKGAARVELLDGVALRGAVSSGFRAPSLQQLWFNNVSTLFVNNPASNMLEATQVLTSDNASPVTRAFGIPQLKQETSLNASGGLTFHPLRKLSITADAYYVRIENRIVLTSRFANTNPVVANVLAQFPSVSQAQFFANAIDTATHGVDLVADYTLDLSEVALNFTLSANYTKTKVTDVRVPPSLTARFAADPGTLRATFFGRQEESRLEDAIPHVRGMLAVRLSWRELMALARATYYGGVSFKADSPANDESFGAKTLFDLEVGYPLFGPLRLMVGADNLLNTFPDKQKKEANISAGRFVYSRNVSQFGQNGGFYYGKLLLTLR